MLTPNDFENEKKLHRFKTYANQRSVATLKVPTDDSSSRFSIINNEAFMNLCRETKGRDRPWSAIMLWLYLDMCSDGYYRALSSADFVASMAVTRDGYDTAFNKLIEMGYIRQVDNKKHFLFVEDGNNGKALDANGWDRTIGTQSEDSDNAQGVAQ